NKATASRQKKHGVNYAWWVGLRWSLLALLQASQKDLHLFERLQIAVALGDRDPLPIHLDGFVVRAHLLQCLSQIADRCRKVGLQPYRLAILPHGVWVVSGLEQGAGIAKVREVIVGVHLDDLAKLFQARG